jgi:hypothetical protein
MYGDSRKADEIIWNAEDARAAMEEHNWELARQKLQDVQLQIQGLLHSMDAGRSDVRPQPLTERKGMLGF